MKTNVAEKFTEQTHEGARAARINAEQQLRRSVMSCMLWESEFYEDGEDIAKRIATLAAVVPFEKVAAVAIEAREQMKLRHAPLWLTVALIKAKHQGRKVGDLIARVCQRADEPAELLAMYWKDQPQAPLTKQLKVGLARALGKFDEHQLAKYNRDGVVKLRDVLFLSHAKPRGSEKPYTKAQRKDGVEYELTEHELLYKAVAENTLATPDTWEVELSSGADKAATFRRLMAEDNLGGLAFLRNFRNMEQTGITKAEISAYGARVKLGRVLPFRFISAANAVPTWEDAIEPMMYRALAGKPKFLGHTVLLIDGSASMDQRVSAKSDITRRDAACALGILLRELCEDVRVIGFSSVPWDIPPRRGFALRDAIRSKVIAQSTMLGTAVRYAQQKPADRIIVITDEQSQEDAPNPTGTGYVINVASAKNGIGYGKWTHIDGWSEAVIDYIRQTEAR